MSYTIKSEFKWNGAEAMALFDSAQLKALTESAILVEGKAKEKAPVNKQVGLGGQLRDSITRLIKKDKAYVGTTTEYASHVEFGTRPHVITPKKGKFLVFTIGGKKIFTKKVNHPGTEAQPFLRPAFQSSITKIKEIFKKHFKAVKYVD